MNILVTGASGFVGTALLPRLAEHQIRAIGRKQPKTLSEKQFFRIEIDADADFSEALKDVDLIIHAAARVHVMQDTAEDSLAQYREVNTFGTLNLARQAAAAGVRRFIFISSVKVCGEETELNRPFFNTDDPAPVDPYGISKLEAETGLFQLAEKSTMDVVVIRPPLVYGPGVKANFQTMMKWVKKGVPLPLGNITNRRSFVYVGNLCALIVCCMHHANASNQCFLVSDDEDVSTTELLSMLATAYSKPARLFPVPKALMRLASALLGRSAMISRLYGSLQVDIEYTRKTLDWKPEYSLAEGLKITTQGSGDQT